MTKERTEPVSKSITPSSAVLKANLPAVVSQGAAEIVNVQGLTFASLVQILRRKKEHLRESIPKLVLVYYRDLGAYVDAYILHGKDRSKFGRLSI